MAFVTPRGGGTRLQGTWARPPPPGPPWGPPRVRPVPPMPSAGKNRRGTGWVAHFISIEEKRLNSKFRNRRGGPVRSGAKRRPRPPGPRFRGSGSALPLHTSDKERPPSPRLCPGVGVRGHVPGLRHLGVLFRPHVGAEPTRPPDLRAGSSGPLSGASSVALRVSISPDLPPPHGGLARDRFCARWAFRGERGGQGTRAQPPARRGHTTRRPAGRAAPPLRRLRSCSGDRSPSRGTGRARPGGRAELGRGHSWAEGSCGLIPAPL